MNAMSIIQQQVIIRLTEDDAKVPSLAPANGEIQWITEDKGDLANIVARATGKMGIVGIVLTPGGGKMFRVGIFPIAFNCPVVIQVQENVTVNRGAAGTQIPVLDIVQFCMRRLHLWSPSDQRVNKLELQEVPYGLVSEIPILTYNVLFNAKVSIQ